MSQAQGEGRVRPGPLRSDWFADIIRPIRPLLRDVFFTSAFVNLLALGIPVFVLQVYDRVVFHAGLSTLQGLVVGMMLVLVFDYVLRQARSRMMQAIALQMDARIGRRLFHKVMALPLRVLEGRPLAYWQQVFGDVDVMRNSLTGPSALAVFDLPYAALFISLIWIIAPPLGPVVMLALAGFTILAWLSARSVSTAAGSERKATQTRDALLAETIMGRTTVKALALEEGLRPLWETRQAEAISASLARGGRTDRYVNIGHLLTIATTLAMTTVGALAIINQDMTIGGLIASNMLSGRMLGPFNQLVGAWRSLVAFRQSASRLDGLFAETEDRDSSAVALTRPVGRLTLETVSYRYRAEGRPVLDGVALDIVPGGITAIMGRNGSGKTTLLKLMLGLYRPAEGRVLLDGADIAQFTRGELARWIGYVPQETVLFTGSIRDNITKGRSDASDEQVVSAAEAAGLHQMVVDLPDGYATDVGEAGSLLSGGMRQRMAIARALVGDPPVLVFDEPSGSLDRAAEEHLRDALVTLARDHTVIVVTHSPVLLQACRTLVVMEAGKVAVSGPAQEVMGFLASRGRPQQRAAVPTSAPVPVPEGSA